MSSSTSIALILNQDESVKSIFSNYCQIITEDAYMCDKLFFNEFENNVHVINVFWNREDHVMNDEDIGYIRKSINILYRIDNEKNIISAMSFGARMRKYNPLVDKLKSLQWDGEPRIHNLLHKYLGADRSEYTTAVTKMLLYGAIQRILHPGIKFDNCVIFADRIQGSGKSTMCRLLAMEDKYFCDNLNDLGDSDKAYRKIRTAWIVELGEMVATRNTKTVEEIKAFLSRTHDTYTEKWSTITENVPRHSIFIGTSNKPEFLPNDPTGQRRFYPVLCNGRLAEKHPLENEQETRGFILQCYAEAMVSGESEGWPLTLDKKFDEELARMREASSPDDTRIPVIQEWLDSLDINAAVCSRMIYFECLHKNDEHPRDPEKWELQELSDIMNLSIEGWKKYKSSGGGDRKKIHTAFHDYGGQRAWVREENHITVEVIQNWLDSHDEINTVCANLIWDEAIPHDEIKKRKSPIISEVKEIDRIMHDDINGWEEYENPSSTVIAIYKHKMDFKKYGVQTAWIRVDRVGDKEGDSVGDNVFFKASEPEIPF